MSERNLLNNGRFRHNLDGWTVSGATYSAGDGDDHYGVAILSTGGDYIEQDFSVSRSRSYSLRVALKSSVALTAGVVTIVITDDDGNTVVTYQPTGIADTWLEFTYTPGLVPGTTFTIRVTNVSVGADVKTDDVWIWYVPITRQEIALRVHAKLSTLASDNSLSYSPDDELTEGDYTYAVDAGMRSAGAVNPETGEVDVRYIDEDMVQTVLDLAEREMLEYLRNVYATVVDVQVGPRRESYSQVSKALGEMTGKDSSAPGGVIMRNLDHEAEDYEFDQ